MLAFMGRFVFVFFTLVACGADVTKIATDAGDHDGGENDNCAGTASESIFLVDNSSHLLDFDPETNSFTTIGTLACPAGVDATPFSMSVDRSGTAWVLYSDSQLFKVSTTDASCTPTNFTPSSQEFSLFGMGFASESVGSSAETLYISGFADEFGNSRLATLNTQTFAITPVGNLALPSGNSPELTGNGNGELWGYFPGGFTTPSTVTHLNKSTASAIQSWEAPAVFLLEAWAFAHYGGRYYIFNTDAGTNQVQLLDPNTNTATTVLNGTPYTIVGAGVSTCAPVTVD